MILVHFESVEDFKNRICRLWQDQKENEMYNFSFENDEVEDAFLTIADNFNEMLPPVSGNNREL